ncbi:MAG: SH3 domain-containing protein, partial [Candidatus Riflebacteria bacterium]|nr:SH3 domain-containing protein [Candidatus Riflebacteria bacterium]
KTKNCLFTVALAISLFSVLPGTSTAKTPFSVDTVEIGSKSSAASKTTTAEATTQSNKAQSASKKSIKKGKVRADVLNVRKGPWSDILGTIKKNDSVNIVGSLGDWYEIEHNGKKAYVHSKWVDVDGVKRNYPDSGEVSNCYWLNVRRAPGGDILGQFKAGTKVEILGSVGDWYKISYNGNEAFVAKRYIDSPSSSTKQTPKTPEFKSFNGYVNASIGLNVRDGVWGNVVTALPNGTKIKVIGKTGDWYKINYNGTTRYVHASYVSNSAPKSSSSGSRSTSTPAPASGNLQKKIVSSAKSLVGSTRFRGSEVSGGRLACAQVVTTALKNAGALNNVHLNCRSAVTDLKSKGWKEVSVPPFREGDVILWKTYDYTGDGIKDPDTHIGIMVKEGNTFKAMNNSSSLRTPRLSDPYSIGPITRVLRKS